MVEVDARTGQDSDHASLWCDLSLPSREALGMTPLPPPQISIFDIFWLDSLIYFLARHPVRPVVPVNSFSPEQHCQSW